MFGAILHSSLHFKWQAGQSCSLPAVVCILDPGFMRQHTWLVNVQLPLLICSDISQPEITASPVWLVTYRTPLLHWETMVVCALKITCKRLFSYCSGTFRMRLVQGLGRKSERNCHREAHHTDKSGLPSALPMSIKNILPPEHKVSSSISCPKTFFDTNSAI